MSSATSYTLVGSRVHSAVTKDGVDDSTIAGSNTLPVGVGRRPVVVPGSGLLTALTGHGFFSVIFKSRVAVYFFVEWFL